MSKQGSEHPASKDYIISDNITNNTEQPRGTSRAYLLDRLKRDHPTKYQQVLDGEKSANKAAIEAGSLDIVGFMGGGCYLTTGANIMCFRTP